MSILSKISIHSDERSARLAGIALMLAGVCMFAFGDALGKVLVASYPVSGLLLLRAAVPLAILLALIWRQRASLPRLERPGLQLLRMVLSTAEVAAFFVAVVYLPLADVITYYLACPIFVTALSAIILREQVGWRRWSAGAGGFSFAVLMIVARSLRATPDIVLAATQFAGTFSVGLVLAPFAWRMPGLPDLGLFVLAGCISIVALLCTNRSLKLAPASVVVPYQYSMIVWAVMFGYVVFGDVPSVATIVGAAIIIGAGLYIFIREQQLGRVDSVSPPV